MKDKTRHLLIILCFILSSFHSSAQVSDEIKQRLITEIENRLPKIINEGQDQFKVIQIDRLDIGKKRTKLKGAFDIDLFYQDVFEEDIAFKTKLRYKNKDLELQYFKVHFPGDKFLFFKRYRNLIP